MHRSTVRFLCVLTFLPALLLAGNPLVVPMTAEDLAAMESNTDRKLLVGVTKDLGAELNLSGLRPQDLRATPSPAGFGHIQRTADGFTWSGAIESPGATAMRLHFSNFFLPNNATITLSSTAGDSFSYAGFGPAGTGEFWSNTLRGDRVELTVTYSGNDLGRVLQALRFVVAEVGPLGPKFPVANPEAGNELCGYNEPCVVNASCLSNPAVATAQDAVAMILFVSGAFQYICSGGLVGDGSVPYFLTANHCLSREREADTLEAYFDFTTPCGSCDDGISDEPRTLGSAIVAENGTSDFTLLRLDQAAPAGTAFLTPNPTPVANSDGVALYRISHPAGAPQAYSSQVVDTSRPTCSSWPRGNWIYSTDVEGATEGGSSGSPVVNAAGEVVGQLSGACGFNVNDPCDSVNNATVDGALAAYWSQVEPFLGGGGGGCTDADGDGVCASEDCNDNNAAVFPGATEACDGVDNDCDLQIDEGCSAGGCDLLPSDASCSADSQCCSGNCKGKPGSQTCK
ncbi:MAG: trypsin-like peptidase domain-containing protein [Thermoanaerobaculia bacterium]